MSKLSRRKVLKTAGIGAAATAIAAPAIAQSMPELKWRLTTSFPKSLDTLHGSAEIFAKAVADATDRRFQIQVFAAGEIAPPFSAADVVENGTVEQCISAWAAFIESISALAFASFPSAILDEFCERHRSRHSTFE